MEINNSQCEVYLAVLTGIYHDLVSAILTKREIERDLVEIQARVRHEGIAFLTKALPSLGKAIDRSLASGEQLRFQGFKKRSGTQLPAFAGGLISCLFDALGRPLFAKERPDSCRETVEGVSQLPGPREGLNPSRETMIMALRGLRQICYLVYKLDIPYHEDQNKKVVDDFVSTDRALPRITAQYGSNQTQAVTKQARALISRVLCNSDPKSGIPKHGPGAVSTGESAPEKHRFKRIYTRLEREYKVTEWFFLNSSHVSEDFGRLQSMTSLKAGCAKVVLVPKDSRGPRLISCEPLELQWIQQSQMAVLVDAIESHKLTAGHVNFRDQTVNQRLALEGSQGNFPWVTLDMKEASDRVGLRLVYSLFPPHWFGPLYSSRSSHTLLPNGTRLRMKKFAPMGSAVCFPVEALTFWAISVATLMIHKNMQLWEAAARVFVYGDDIVLHSDDHGVVHQQLELYGLLVNKDKCCTAGPFKESCGMDAFYGTSVTPLKLRQPWMYTPKPSVLLSWTAFSNAAWDRGLHTTALIVEQALQSVYRHRIPTVTHRNPAINCFVRPDQDVRPETQPNVKYRWNIEYQRLEVQGFALRPMLFKTKVWGYELLLRLLAEKERSEPLEGSYDPPSSHLIPTGMYAMAHRVKPTRAWTAAG